MKKSNMNVNNFDHQMINKTDGEGKNKFVIYNFDIDNDYTIGE